MTFLTVKLNFNEHVNKTITNLLISQLIKSSSLISCDNEIAVDFTSKV